MISDGVMQPTREYTMSAAGRCFLIFCLILLLIPSGSKNNASATAGNATTGEENIASVRAPLACEMSEMVLAELNSTHLGKKCLVIAHAPTEGYRPTAPAPPSGMVRELGQMLIYETQLDRISDDSINVSDRYPTAGLFKKIEIERNNVQSFHFAP